jgi:hypothetical protein
MNNHDAVNLEKYIALMSKILFIFFIFRLNEYLNHDAVNLEKTLNVKSASF